MKTKTAIASTLAILLGVLVCMAAPASAKGKGSKDPCRKADIKLAKTGVGDTDGDGVSDCRETKVLRTDPNDPDTDDDGLDDGDEIQRFCHARKPDTDDDGEEDGEDETPVVKQKVEAILDAIYCPVPAVPETPESPGTPAVPGAMAMLGIIAAIDANTDFEHTTCEDLVARLALAETLIIKVEIFEDMLGALTATKVDLKKRPRGHDDDDDHEDDDDEDDDHEDDDHDEDRWGDD